MSFIRGDKVVIKAGYQEWYNSGKRKKTLVKDGQELSILMYDVAYHSYQCSVGMLTIFVSDDWLEVPPVGGAEAVVKTPVRRVRKPKEAVESSAS